MKDIHKIALLILAAVLVIPGAGYAQSNSGTTSPAPVSGSNPGNTGNPAVEKGHHVKKPAPKQDHKQFPMKSRHKMKGGTTGGKTSGSTTSPAGGH